MLNRSRQPPRRLSGKERLVHLMAGLGSLLLYPSIHWINFYWTTREMMECVHDTEYQLSWMIRFTLSKEVHCETFYYYINPDSRYLPEIYPSKSITTEEFYYMEKHHIQGSFHCFMGTGFAWEDTIDLYIVLLGLDMEPTRSFMRIYKHLFALEDFIGDSNREAHWFIDICKYSDKEDVLLAETLTRMGLETYRWTMMAFLHQIQEAARAHERTRPWIFVSAVAMLGIEVVGWYFIFFLLVRHYWRRWSRRKGEKTGGAQVPR